MKVDRTQQKIVTLIPENSQDVIDLVEAKHISPKELADRYEVKVGEVINLAFIKGTVSFKRESEIKFEQLPS